MIELAYWWMDYTKKGLLRQGKGRPSMAVLGYAVVRRLLCLPATCQAVPVFGRRVALAQVRRAGGQPSGLVFKEEGSARQDLPPGSYQEKAEKRLPA